MMKKTNLLFKIIPFGFLNVEIENNGKTLVGTFHANDWKYNRPFQTK